MDEKLIKEYLEAEDLQKMFQAATAKLLKKKEILNALNVFPVPDGDTGTNMYLTMKSAIDELAVIDHMSIAKVCGSLSMGALMGARGNSGVILSQILRGITRSLAPKEKINTTDFAKALQEGTQAAYKAVMRPTEGTILTVVKEAAKEASAQARNHRDFSAFMERIIKKAEETLEKTPEMLPVLKEAGVVDAGGAGLVEIFYGFLAGIDDEEVDQMIEQLPADRRNTLSVAQAVLANSSDIEFAYCTEMIVLGEGLDEEILQQKLAHLGDSLLVVGESNILKVHVHTNHPGKALEAALELGTLSKIKIENMRDQHHHLVMDSLPIGEKNPVRPEKKEALAPAKLPNKPIAIVSIATGTGIAEIFLSLGADLVIEGGQTMNPSTEDIVNAIEQSPSQVVLVLPNNKNIIMAAQQAQQISTKEIYVIPTKSIPQGIAALLAFNPEQKNHQALADSMEEASMQVVTGQLTYAIRDTMVDNQQIKAGDYMALCDGEIAASSPEIDLALEKLMEMMLQDSREIVTIYYGENVEKEAAEKFQQKMMEKYPEHDIELYYGGQPVYYYIISAE